MKNIEVAIYEQNDEEIKDIVTLVLEKKGITLKNYDMEILSKKQRHRLFLAAKLMMITFGTPEELEEEYHPSPLCDGCGL